MADRKKAIGFWGFILRLINWILIIALLFSYLAQWISPSHFWMLAFFGMAYPVLLILNILFIIHWLLRRRKFVIYPLIVVLMGIGMISRFFNMGSNSEYVDSGNTLKVMTYNVHVFGRYAKGKQGASYYNRDEILKLVEKEKPDILCMQEFRSVNVPGSKENNLKLFRKKAGFKYVYARKYSPKSKNFYLVIFSKYPIVESGTIWDDDVEGSVTAVYADIKVKSTLIRVYSLHLQSYQISSDTYLIKKSMNSLDISKEENQEQLTKTSKHFIRKFKIAFEKRSKQIDAISAHIEDCPYPVILAGDFNDTPSSYAYAQLTEKLDDSFTESGSGFDKTYRGPYPSFRIDYILHSPEFTAYQYKTLKVNYSDHYPVSTVLSME